MEKNKYEALKSLRAKVAAGTANFSERNIVRIADKKKAKGQKPTFNLKSRNANK